MCEGPRTPHKSALVTRYAALVFALGSAAGLPALGCNEERQKDCNALLATMKPLDANGANDKVVPSLETVASVKEGARGTQAAGSAPPHLRRELRKYARGPVQHDGAQDQLLGAGRNR